MKKIVTVLGARPQFIKASVVSDAIAQTSTLDEVLIHTGQHFDANMSDVFFSELGIKKPNYFLGINSGSHGDMTGRMLIEVERVLLHEKPDAVLVYGDTNSTLAGALAAVKLHIPVAHVEAGLRSFNMAMPEEVNRVLTDRISRWLFAPTNAAKSHLIREGFKDEQIMTVGDVMYDVAQHYGRRIQADTGLMLCLDISPQKYILATIHRAENTENIERLTAIVDALTTVAHNMPVVWPLHPRTRAILCKQCRLESLSKQLHLIDPVGYLDMVQLEKFAALVVTDSGGVQKEAFFHQVPCVTLRYETEWVELIRAGWNRLAPPIDPNRIAEIIMQSINTKGEAITPYGSGFAACEIVNILARQV
jgi:UDP-GlcNAc3NAcA epimerase